MEKLESFYVKELNVSFSKTIFNVSFSKTILFTNDFYDFFYNILDEALDEYFKFIPFIK